MKKNRILLGILLILINIIPLSGQDKPVVDLSLVSQENIEYSALKSLFFLIRQEYIITARNGEKITRGGNEYFGKAYAIGILTDDLRLWFPKSIRYPWKTDINFNDYQRGYTPECTFTRFKSIEEPFFISNDSLYLKRFLLNNLIDTNDILINYVFGQKGIKTSDTFPKTGSIILFHSSDQNLEKAENIQYSIITIDAAKWNSDGIYEFKVPYLDSQQIIGGAFFQRIISPARIEWMLAGVLVSINNRWVVKSIVHNDSSGR